VFINFQQFSSVFVDLNRFSGIFHRRAAPATPGQASSPKHSGKVGAMPRTSMAHQWHINGSSKRGPGEPGPRLVDFGLAEPLPGVQLSIFFDFLRFSAIAFGFHRFSLTFFGFDRFSMIFFGSHPFSLVFIDFLRISSLLFSVASVDYH
jgi:hypothetical protein